MLLSWKGFGRKGYWLLCCMHLLGYKWDQPVVGHSAVKLGIINPAIFVHRLANLKSIAGSTSASVQRRR
jgi:hypothetical protein